MDLAEAASAAEASLAGNEPSPDLGTAEGAPPTTAEAPEAPAEQVEEVGTPDYSQLVTIKVNGTEEQVSLQEAINGYQRQSDYTQKTQQLAAEREQLSNADRLYQAIEANPQFTIGEIAKAYGYQLTPAQEAAAEAQRGEEDPFAEPPDPTEQRFQQVEQFMQQAHLERLQAQIDRELVDVHQTYNVQFNDDDLLQYAVDHQISNLHDAFKSFAFELMTRAATDKKIIEQKKAAPPIAGGHGTAAGTVSAGPGVGQKMSIQDAFAAAEAAHAG